MKQINYCHFSTSQETQQSLSPPSSHVSFVVCIHRPIVIDTIVEITAACSWQVPSRCGRISLSGNIHPESGDEVFYHIVSIMVCCTRSITESYRQIIRFRGADKTIEIRYAMADWGRAVPCIAIALQLPCIDLNLCSIIVPYRTAGKCVASRHRLVCYSGR